MLKLTTPLPPTAGRRLTTRRAARAANVSARLCRERGFSLVELMVAMVIGLLGIVVMMQVFSVFEGQKRTTTGGDDAISSGSVSLYSLERAIKQSGWGTSSEQIIGCSVTGLASVASVAIPLVPVTINSALVPAGDANSDTLLIVSGNGNGTVEGDLVNSLTTATSYNVHTSSAFLVGERVVVAPQATPVPCSLLVTRVSGVAYPNVNVAAAAGFAVKKDDKLFNLGAAPTVRGYAVRGGNLTSCDYTLSNCSATATATVKANWVSIASNVVSLRAQYGRDTNPAGMDGVIDVWDQTIATPATPFSTTKNTVACGLYRGAALRVALLARNSQPERVAKDGSHVTPDLPRWAGSDDTAIDIDADAAGAVAFDPPSPDATWPTWQDFRYKVFQTVVPLRNITSMGALLIPAGRAPSC